VIQAVAALDLRFQEGNLAEADYRSERQGLIARVLDPDTSQDGAPDEADDGVRPE